MSIRLASSLVAMFRTMAALALVAVSTGSAILHGAPPLIETRPAELHGLTGLSVNGRIHPRGEAVSYYFEYGPTPNYGQKTPIQPLPPRLAAFFHETWDAGVGAWSGGMNGKDLRHHPQGGASGGFVRFSEPSGFDPNHTDGIGGLHLCKYFYPGSHPGGKGFDAWWGGGDPDLRDARVKISVRGQKWDPQGSEIVWWSQSDKLIAEQFTPNWRRSNWAYTGFSLNDLLSSGRWEQAEYRLKNETWSWTYGGDNLAQKRPNYVYWNINDAMRHLNCDFFHLAAFVDVSRPPTGAIDFDEFQVAYRNHSLLLPSNGGKLLTSPTNSADDPATLTDGWRHGPGRSWKSAANPTTPLAFVYTFDKPVTLETVQIHQHAEWPSREVQLEISDDGKTWKPLLQRTLPEKSPGGPDFAFLLERKLKASARFVKVTILSGFRKEHWGLGEIELFGTGATMRCDDDWYHVNHDLLELPPGGTIHYRLVAVGPSGTTHGPPQTITLPQDTKPHTITLPATRVTSSSAKLEGRLNPLGSKTEFYFDYGTDDKYGQKTPPQYGGLQITPRTAFFTVENLKPNTTYHYRLVANNPKGESRGADTVLRTK